MSSLLPITLIAKQGNWQKHHARSKRHEFKNIATKIYSRDRNRCRFCGFELNMKEKAVIKDVINLDSNYDHNYPKNMVTVCGFCKQCFFLDIVGKVPKTGGHIIHLPEINQADLNNFCRIMFTALRKNSLYKEELQKVYFNLKDRTKAVEDAFGENSSTPCVFGQCMIDSYLDEKQLQHPILADLRLLPKIKPFDKEIEYWHQETFSKLPL